jgi:hypothetical protein
MLLPGMIPVFNRAVAAPAGYVGAGDVVAGATAWWGLRGYNAAVSNGTTKAVNIRRASDNTTQDFVILSNGSLDVASIATFISGTTGFVTKLYDQTGNGNDLVQATAAKQPQIFLNAIGSLPVAYANGAIPQWVQTAGGFSLNQPDSTALVYFDNNTASNAGVAATGTGASVQSVGVASPSAGNVYIYAGTVLSVASTQGAWHSLQGLYNSTSSKLNLDNVLTTGDVGTGNISTSTEELFASSNGNFPFTGYILESGWWGGDQSSQFSALYSNQSSYWGYGSYDIATQAWVQQVLRNGGSVSTTRQGVVDTLIKGLKTDGVWSKLDRLWLFAAENSQAALTDLVGLTLATANGSPTFTTDRGYTGQDLATPTAYVDSGYNPSSGATFTQNSAHISAWSVTNNAASNGGCLMGADTSGGGNSNINLFDTYLDGNVYGRINDAPASGSQGAPGTRQGHWIANRSGASASQVYQNGSNFSSPNATSGAVPNTNLFILCDDNSASGPINGTPNQLAMASAGGSLSSTDASNFYSRLRTYMTAVGVP